MDIFLELKSRNEILFWFGCLNFLTTAVLIYFSFSKPIEFAGTNAWYKPIKFALSTFILSWSLAWYMGYLAKSADLNIVSWTIVVTLAFEVIYIALQASKGIASHYNQSTPFYSLMFLLMALAATIATIAIGYIGLKFFTSVSIELPAYYLWSIRLGILLFVVFSFEGFLMGGKGAHTVGGPENSVGLPFVNWSLSHGDLRIAHFVGMHALQILPILAWYLLKETSLTIIVSIVYGLLALLILVQALKGISITQTFNLK